MQGVTNSNSIIFQNIQNFLISPWISLRCFIVLLHLFLGQLFLTSLYIHQPKDHAVFSSALIKIQQTYVAS